MDKIHFRNLALNKHCEYIASHRIGNKVADKNGPVWWLVCAILSFKEKKRNGEKQPQINQPPYGPRREETCLQGFQQSETQTNLPSYKD